MTTRIEQKTLTRKKLLDAAKQELSAERSFSSLSLREVTRGADVAPPAFYRHFRDMDDLGLALVDEAGLALRQLMREGRKRVQSRGEVIRTSIDTFLDYLCSHGPEFRLLVGEGYGASVELRAAVQRERRYFSTELAEDIERLAEHRGRAFSDVTWVADAMVALAFSNGQQMLDLPTTQREEVAGRLMRQIYLLMLGAERAHEMERT